MKTNSKYLGLVTKKFNDQLIKQIIARWQKGQKIFAFLYWI